jgi:hypothetical protein
MERSLSVKTLPVAAGYHGGVQPLSPRPWKAPQRKFRGKRKYFRQVLRQAGAFRLDVDPPWWDFWHHHADWPGWGNLSWKCRLAHLRALAIVFHKVLEASPRIPLPFQTWILLNVDDAGYDGVYVHSHNPNHSNFPFKPEATWGVGALDETMAALLPSLRLRTARCTWVGQDDEGAPSVTTTYLVYSPDTGVPLE